MSKMSNLNLEFVKSHFTIEAPEDYYIIDIVKGRVNNNPLIIKTYYVRDNEWHSIDIQEMIDICQFHGAKAIFYPKVCNNQKTAREAFGCLADIVAECNFTRGEHLWHDTSLANPKYSEPNIYSFEVENEEWDIIYPLVKDVYLYSYNYDKRIVVITKPFKISKFQSDLMIYGLNRRLIFIDEPILLYE